MIDPQNVDLRSIQTPVDKINEFWLYSFLVAGKTSTTIAPRLDAMLLDLYRRATNTLNGASSPKTWDQKRIVKEHADNKPFKLIEYLITQEAFCPVEYLRDWGFGQQQRTLKFFRDTVHLFRSKTDSGISEYPIKYWSLEEISSIHGVGLKTSRFFCMNTRFGTRMAALDTHIIKYLKGKELIPEDAPLVTPTSVKVYKEYEAKFLEVADRNNRDPRDFDQEIWNHYSKKQGKACRESIAA